ncbi:MAG: GNAT family N-acetyltransferase [Thermoflexales bacterium]|nr:GNAT family N-acetyltransferase [Thermoflexales bacterium]
MSFSIRNYHDEDLGSVFAVINAAARADGEPDVLSEAELRARLEIPHDSSLIDPQQDLSVVEIPGAGVVAYAEGLLRGGRGKWFYRTQCFVQPDFRRRGIGRALLERQWERVEELAAQLGGRVLMGARVLDTQQDAQALLKAFSMRRTRYFFTMRRDLAAPLPSLEPPPGLDLRRWDDRRGDRVVWAAAEEAFADHWGYQPQSWEAFEHRIHSGQIRPASSFIAWDGDEVAGGSLNKFSLPDPVAPPLARPGWVGTLFVRRPWRRHGLGRALLLASLAHARQMGHDVVLLNVDAASLTGAVHLYESVGFGVAVRRVVYQRVCRIAATHLA